MTQKIKYKLDAAFVTIIKIAREYLVESENEDAE